MICLFVNYPSLKPRSIIMSDTAGQHVAETLARQRPSSDTALLTGQQHLESSDTGLLHPQQHLLVDEERGGHYFENSKTCLTNSGVEFSINEDLVKCQELHTLCY